MILNHDLQMFAAMNGINRASGHAMRIGAGTTRSRNQKAIEALTGAKQTRNGNPVGLGSVFVHAGARACVAARAVVQIEDKDALTFVKTLLGVLVENAMANVRAVQARERLLNHSAANDTKLAQHLKEISPVQLRQLQIV